jgi:formylmethanofuran dehydrogenase subunit C
MPLVLECQSKTSLPIEVEGVLPIPLRNLSSESIAKLPIWNGKNKLELGELFRVTGTIDESDTIVWVGNLQSVHGIGLGMDGGVMQVDSPAGRHVGAKMSGGSIEAKSDVSDFVGVEMTGGTIRVRGNSGDLTGGNYPGSKIGMNRGSIIVDGNAGRGTGQAMRRGTIAIGGDSGKLCGWNMLAGSIIVCGNCASEFGVGMTRGTLVLLDPRSGTEILPTFAKGGVYQNTIVKMMASWLQQIGFEAAERLAQTSFQMHHGDLLSGGRGEVLIALDSGEG